MSATQIAGKLDWVAILTLVLTASTILAAPVVYLNKTLHQIENRLTRIEVHMGIDEPGISLTKR